MRDALVPSPVDVVVDVDDMSDVVRVMRLSSALTGTDSWGRGGRPSLKAGCSGRAPLQPCMKRSNCVVRHEKLNTPSCSTMHDGQAMPEVIRVRAWSDAGMVHKCMQLKDLVPGRL